MDHTPSVEIGQPVGHGDEGRDELVGSQPLAVARPIGQRAALAELHHEERLSTTLRVAGIDVEDADDPRVRGRGQGARFPLEPLGHDRITREVGQQHLDRDFATQALVIRPVDGRHAARTERGKDSIAPGEEVSAGWHGAEGTPTIARRSRASPA